MNLIRGFVEFEQVNTWYLWFCHVSIQPVAAQSCRGALRLWDGSVQTPERHGGNKPGEGFSCTISGWLNICSPSYKSTAWYLWLLLRPCALKIISWFCGSADLKGWTFGWDLTHLLSYSLLMVLQWEETWPWPGAAVLCRSIHLLSLSVNRKV